MVNKYPQLLTIVTAILLLAILPSIVAQPTYKQGSNATLSVPCTIGGNPCSVNASCIGTVIRRDTSGDVILYNDVALQQNGSIFSLNLTSQDTAIKGDYLFNVACYQDGRGEAKTLSFTVGDVFTTSGNGLLDFNLNSLPEIIALVVLGLISIGLLITKKYLYSGASIILCGLILFFSGFQILVSVIVLVIGFVLLFVHEKEA